MDIDWSAIRNAFKVRGCRAVSMRLCDVMQTKWKKRVETIMHLRNSRGPHKMTWRATFGPPNKCIDKGLSDLFFTLPCFLSAIGVSPNQRFILVWIFRPYSIEVILLFMLIIWSMTYEVFTMTTILPFPFLCSFHDHREFLFWLTLSITLEASFLLQWRHVTVNNQWECFVRRHGRSVNYVWNLKWKARLSLRMSSKRALNFSGKPRM